MRKIHRRVSVSEKLYLSGEQYFSHVVMHCLVEGAGTIPTSELQSAVDNACKLLPGSRLRLVGSHWVPDASPPRVEPLPEFPSISSELTPLVQRSPRFAPKEGKTSSVQLISEGGRTFLHFRVLHAVMDGQGMQAWIKTIFAFLRGEDPDWKDSGLTEDDILLRSPTRNREE